MTDLSFSQETDHSRGMISNNITGGIIMFQPKLLSYLGKENGMDSFDYDGIHVYAMIINKNDGRYLYVGIGKNVPLSLRNGLLSWFGIDQQREYTLCELPDKSCFYYQKRQRKVA